MTAGPCRAGTLSQRCEFPVKALRRCTRRWSPQRDDPTKFGNVAFNLTQ